MLKMSDIRRIDDIATLPYEKRVEQIKWLIKNGKINDTDRFGRTSLYLAVVYSHRSTKIIKLLIKNGADVNAECTDHKTPLFVASDLGDYYHVKILLDAGADPNKCDMYNVTPLHVACRKGYLKTARSLIEKGAAVNKEDSYFRSPLYIASDNQHLDIMKLLVENGANVETDPRRNYISRSAIHRAAMLDHVEVAKLLIENGVDLNSTTGEFKRTPLEHAIENRNLDLAVLMLEHDANPWLVSKKYDYMKEIDVAKSGWTQKRHNHMFSKKRKMLIEVFIKLSCMNSHFLSRISKDLVFIICKKIASY
jgi:ankyrin repeat protein